MVYINGRKCLIDFLSFSQFFYEFSSFCHSIVAMCHSKPCKSFTMLKLFNKLGLFFVNIFQFTYSLRLSSLPVLWLLMSQILGQLLYKPTQLFTYTPFTLICINMKLGLDGHVPYLALMF